MALQRTAVPHTDVQEEQLNDSVYARLCDLADITPLKGAVALEHFASTDHMAASELEERLTAAVQVFLSLVVGSDRPIETIDKSLLDQFIAQIDEVISGQMDAILHHPSFQAIESTWRGLWFLIERCDFRSNVKVEIIDCSKEALREDFEEAPETIQTGMYKHIYIEEYDTPGGEPVSAVIANFEFDSSHRDITLLTDVSRVAAAAHCPFLSSVGPKFFGKEDIDDLPKIQDLANYMEKAEFVRWRSFRENEDSRYVGLTLPSYMLRLPYGADTVPVRGFNYQEDVSGENHTNYLCGNSVFAFGANVARSFAKHGWTVNIRGPESGGKIENLPVHYFDAGKGLQPKIPTEILIPETRELEFANLGFIPLSYYKNSDFACFFSANSVQRPAEYETVEATANSRINSRLPYIFLVSRIAHYLKVLQRENIGTTKNRKVLEVELNNWLRTLVTKMKDPDPELIAHHPLKDGEVVVQEIPENPGYYSVSLFIVPHFQIEGIDVRLSLVAQMPKAEK